MTHERVDVPSGEREGPPYLPPFELHEELITYMEAGPRRDPSERRTFWRELWRKLGVLFGP
jgi:hypothetical protein